MNDKLNGLLTTLKGFGTQKMDDIGLLPFLAVTLVSLAAALFVSYLYVQFYGKRSTGSMVHTAFPLLGVSVTAIFICIQFSLPLSLGLLGALSIVRFRTPVKEPEEIGFIMVVIACSLCCATFNMAFLGIILTAVVIALVVRASTLNLWSRGSNGAMLVVTLPRREYRDKQSELMEFLANKLPHGKIDSAIENDDDAVVSYRLPGVTDERTLTERQRELAEISDQVKSAVFFGRSA